jgi:hypothetical protein
MSFFTHALKHGASQDPDNRDVEQLGLIRLCGMCSAWHIPIIGIMPMHLLQGMSKKRHTRAPYETHNLEDIAKKKTSPCSFPQLVSQGDSSVCG